MNIVKGLIYSLIFASLFAISLIVSMDLKAVSLPVTVTLSALLTFYLFQMMNLISIRKLISGFYFKENSNDIKMKLISYMMIFHTYFFMMFISIVACVTEVPQNIVLSYVLSISLKTLIIYSFTILLLFAMSIKPKEKNEVQSNSKE